MRVFKGLSELPDISDSVITIGSFDGVHAGHQKIIDRLKQLSSQVGCENYIITFHPHPRSIIYPKDKSLKLLSSLEEKIKLFDNYGVDNLVIVPFTIEFSQISALEYIDKFLVGKFNPRYLVIGYDHRFGINRTGDINLLRQVKDTYNFNIVEIPAQEMDELTISSSKIRLALQNGDLYQANNLLNHPYQISGKVIRGRKLGTEIGFPTANLELEDSKKLVPMDGIYACKVNTNKGEYNGMLYIGDVPTVGLDHRKSIEINIFDFNDDIYDERISVEILHFIRHEQKFDGIESLKQQLHKDRDSALEYFSDCAQRPKAKVCIAILNYNTQHLLEDFLPSISYSSDEEFDVVLIDNASSDHSVEYVNKWFPEIKVIQMSKNYGFAEAYNRAMDMINSEYIVMLNSDVMVNENWLDPITKFLEENKDYAVAMPKVLSYEEQDSFEYAGASGGYIDALAYPFCRGRIFDTVEQDEGQYDSVESVFWATGAAFVIRKELYVEMGGFDNDFFAHHEEIDLCWRLRNAGYRIAVIPESVVYHLGGGTLEYDNKRKIYLNFRNNLFTLFKNESFFSLLWKLPSRLVMDGIAGLNFMFQLKFNGVLAILLAHFSFYKNIFKLINKRRITTSVINKYRIYEPNLEGRFQGSIVFQYFILCKKRFSQLSFPK